MKLTTLIAGILAGLAATFSALTFFRGSARGAAPASSALSLLETNRAGNSRRDPGTTLCIMEKIDTHNCKEGEVAWFMPPRWGSDQLPLAFAAMVCDFRHPVVWNNGGVVCIYTNVRREQPDPSARVAAPAASNSAAPTAQ